MSGVRRAQCGSVATFVDWSPGLYVHALSEQAVTSGALPGHHRPVSGYPMPCAQSGRMFWTNKKTTTKGELSIIDGICRNRSDAHKSKQQALNAAPRSHKSAWNYEHDVTTRRRRKTSASNAPATRDMGAYELGPVRKEAMDLNDYHRVNSSLCHVNQAKNPGVREFMSKKHMTTSAKQSKRGGIVVAKQLQRSSQNPDVLLEKTLLDVYLPAISSDVTDAPSLRYTTHSNRTDPYAARYDAAAAAANDDVNAHVTAAPAEYKLPPLAPNNSPRVSQLGSPVSDGMEA